MSKNSVTETLFIYCIIKRTDVITDDEVSENLRLCTGASLFLTANLFHALPTYARSTRILVVR